MLRAEHLAKAIEGRSILVDVDLEVRDREVLTVVGLSGSGKSVLLKVLIGLLRPDGGRVWLDDEEISRYTEKELNRRVRGRMSMVFQRGALWDSLTVEENVGLALELRRDLEPAERARLVAESLELVGLRQAARAYPGELSGGMIKRAAIARAIATRPGILLYDEPTTGLDPVLTNRVNELIVELNRELHTTSLVVSHDVYQISDFSDRVAMLHEGRIAVTCSADRLWEQQDPLLAGFLHGRLEEA